MSVEDIATALHKRLLLGTSLT